MSRLSRSGSSTDGKWPPLGMGVHRTMLYSRSAHSRGGVPLAWDQQGVLGAIVAVPLLAALYGVLGAGLGLLLRNTAAAVGLALMWAFVVEGIVPALIHQPGISRWLPEAAANAVLHGASPAALPVGVALAVLAGYAAVLAGVGAALTARREIATATG